MCNDIQIKYPPHCVAYGKPTRSPWKRERNIYIQSVPDSADVPSIRDSFLGKVLMGSFNPFFVTIV